jgi:putative membrane protein
MNPFLGLFIVGFLFFTYFFLGQRFESFGPLSKLTMCLVTSAILLRAFFNQGLAHFLLALHAGFWTFVSLTVSFGAGYSGDGPIVLPIVMGPWSIFGVSCFVAMAFSLANERMIHKESYPLLLFILFVWVWVVLAFHVNYFEDWVLENIINVGFLILLYLTYRWFRFSRLSYGLMFTFMVLNIIGSHYTYAEVPFGFWLMDFLELGRNHYDRIVHFSFGFLITYPTREILRRVSSAVGFWSLYIPIEFVLALSAIYEIVEWLFAVVFGGDLGIAHLGTQGDNFDPTKDMALAGSGSVITRLRVGG